MSVKVSSLIWEMDVEPIDKLVLLSYADYSNEDGLGVYPSNETTSKRTGINERSVRRVNRRLELSGYIVPDGKSRYQTNEYRLNLEAISANIAERRAKGEDSGSGAGLANDKREDPESGEGGTQSPGGEDPESGNPSVNPSVNPSDTAETADPDEIEIEPIEVYGTDEPETEISKEESYKARISAALARGQEKNRLSKIDLGNYPEDIREYVRVICERFRIAPPAGRKPSGDWIKSTREVRDICGDLGTDLIQLYADRYYGEFEIVGSVPFTVSRPGSLVNPLRGYLAEIIATGNFEPRSAGKRSRGNSPIEFVK